MYDADEGRQMARLLKLPEVAQRLEVSEKTARRYVKAGVLPSAFVGNAYRVNSEDVEEYLRRAKVEVGDNTPKALSRPSYTAPEYQAEKERRTEGGESANAGATYTPYEAVGRLLASSWKDELEKWDEEIPPGEVPSLFVFGRLFEWGTGIVGTKTLYEAIARDAYVTVREELQDTLRLMEEASQAAGRKFIRVYEPVKTWKEFQKIVKENDLEAILSSVQGDE